MVDYRTKIYVLRLSRKILAQRLNLSYAVFSSRLAGFSAWQPGEEERLLRLINEAEQRATAAVPDDPYDLFPESKAGGSLHE